MLGPGDEQEAVLRPRESVDEQLEPGWSANALCACSPPNGTSASGGAAPEITSPQVTALIATSATSDRPSLEGDSDRQRARARQRLATLRVREAPGTWRSKRNQAGPLRELPHPVAEHPGGETASGDDEAGAFRRLGDDVVADRLEREVAERAGTVPTVEALGRRELPRPRAGSNDCVSSQATRAWPWPSLPRRSASSKWAKSASADGSSRPSAPKRASASRFVTEP